MVDAALWYFFGKVCMANVPDQCTRIVFDRPMEVTDLTKFTPRTLTTPASIPLTQPLVFTTWDACAKALPVEFDRHKPFVVEGEEWRETGCALE
jgi:hypothetical protein